MPVFRVYPINESPGRIVYFTHNSMKLGLTRLFSRSGYNITPEHWAVLSILWEEDGLQQAELANRCSKDRPNTTRMLDLLEKNGYIERRKDPNDRRSYRIFLTDKGKDLQPELTSLVIRFLNRAFKGITTEEMDMFVKVNKKIANNLKDGQ